MPGDPANAGFTDGKGGLLIALNPNNNNNASEKESDGGEHEHSDHTDHGHRHADGHDSDDGGDHRLDHPASGAMDAKSGSLVMAALMAMLVVVICSTKVTA